jgi:hypothetical protein
MEISRPDRSIRLARSRVGRSGAADLSPMWVGRDQLVAPTPRGLVWAAILREVPSSKVSQRSSGRCIRWISTQAFSACRTTRRRCSCAFRSSTEPDHFSTKRSILRPLIPSIPILSCFSITITHSRRIASRPPCSFRILGAAMPAPTRC